MTVNVRVVMQTLVIGVALAGAFTLSGQEGRASDVRALGVAAGHDHSCAVTDGGSAFCWGENDVGQLGIGETGDPIDAPRFVCDSIVPLPPILGAPEEDTTAGTCIILSGVEAIAAGGAHTCALQNSGAVQCWGLNNAGQAGDGTTTDRSSATSVTGLSSDVVALALGASHSCALMATGAVACWGFNFQGQLGDGTTTDRHTPVEVPGLDAIAIGAGGGHTCAITVDNALKCWGNNASGQLGDGSTTNRHSPVDAAVDTSGRLAEVSAGEAHTCLVSVGLPVSCWGANNLGQVGDGTMSDRLTQTFIDLHSDDVVMLDAGAFHNCAVVAVGAGGPFTIVLGGGLECWGFNRAGQLGDGTTTERSEPVDVSGIGWGLAVAGGWAHTCASGFLGQVECWGSNASGQLGNGSLTDSRVPQYVSLFVPKGVGDADCGGTVNAIDATLLLQLAAGLIELPDIPCIAESDANQDGAHSAVDAALILQHVAGLLPALPP